MPEPPESPARTSAGTERPAGSPPGGLPAPYPAKPPAVPSVGRHNRVAALAAPPAFRLGPSGWLPRQEEIAQTRRTGRELRSTRPVSAQNKPLSPGPRSWPLKGRALEVCRCGSPRPLRHPPSAPPRPEPYSGIDILHGSVWSVKTLSVWAVAWTYRLRKETGRARPPG